MSGIEIDLGQVSGRTKTLGFVGTALVVALCLIDLIALRGERVAHARVSLGDGAPALIEIVQTGQKHLVEVSTRYRRNGETRGRAVKIQLLDPEGTTVYDSSELTTHKTRYFRFTPVVAGEYTLAVESNGLFVKSTRGSADIDVFVNDRRILARVFSAF
jgi:hypothetical protein